MRQRRGVLGLSVALLAVSVWLQFAVEPAPRAAAAVTAVAAESLGTANGAGQTQAEVAAGGVLQRHESDTAEVPGIAGRLLQDGRLLAGASVCTGDESIACRSGADGTFLLRHGGGSMQLRIRGASIPSGFTFGPIVLATGARYELGDVMVPRPAALTGRVLDEQGRPLAGVAVFAAHADSDAYPVRPAAEASSPSSRSGADGRFLLADLLPGSTEVYVLHADRAMQDCRGDAVVELLAGECLDVGDLVARSAAALHGVVFASTGQPIAGALVTPGGGCSEMQPRRAVRTGVDGGFMLRGFGQCEALRIEADGWQTLACERVDEAARPFVARLQQALVLAGVVRGSRGQPGHVRIVADEQTDGPGFDHQMLRTAYPLAADGSFRIGGLPAGRWHLRAEVSGVGAAENDACELPQQAPLQLTLEPAREVAVQVVDERGVAVGGADVDARCRYSDDDLLTPRPRGKEAVTDAKGLARLWLTPRARQTIRARARGHCGDDIELPEILPAAVMLTLPRGGSLRGRVDAAALRQRAHLWLACARQDDSGRGFAIDTDTRGAFASDALRPGSYTLSLVVADATDQGWSRQPPVPQATPVLGDQVAVGAPVLVEVVAGQETVVDMPAPTLAVVHGRVLAGGAPVADALVYALDDAVEEPYLVPVQLQSGSGRVFCRTDRQGRFHLLAPQAGTFRLRARHARGASWSAPVVVRVEAGVDATCEVRLDRGAIRASFELGALPPVERAGVRACIYRLDDAASDPRQQVWTEDRSQRLQDTVQELQPGPAGAFSFECLPPGDWLLRLVGGGGILVQRVVHLAADEAVDLGPLQLPAGVTPRLRCGLGELKGVQLLQLVDGRETFLRQVDNSAGAGFAWGSVEPGRYHLRATELLQVTLWHCDRSWTSWTAGPPFGEPVDVEVHADGSCTPPVVWPRDR